MYVRTYMATYGFVFIQLCQNYLELFKILWMQSFGPFSIKHDFKGTIPSPIPQKYEIRKRNIQSNSNQ